MSMNVSWVAAGSAAAPQPVVTRPLTPPRTLSRPTTPIKKVSTNVCRAVGDTGSTLEVVALGGSLAPMPMPLPVFRAAIEPGKENAVPQPRPADKQPRRDFSAASLRGGVLLGPQDPTAGLPSKSPMRSQVLGPWVCQSLCPTTETRVQVSNANHGRTMDVDQVLRRGRGPSKRRGDAHAGGGPGASASKGRAQSSSPKASPRQAGSNSVEESPRRASPRQAGSMAARQAWAGETSPRPALRSSPLRGSQYYTSSVPLGGLQLAKPVAASPANRRGVGACSPVRTGMGSQVACLGQGFSAPSPPGAAGDRSPHRQSPNRQSSPVSIIASVSGWGRTQELAPVNAKAASGLAEGRSASLDRQHARRLAESQLADTAPPFRSWSWRPGQQVGATGRDHLHGDRAPQELAVVRPPAAQLGSQEEKIRSLAEAIQSLKVELSIARLSVAEQELKDAASSRKQEEDQRESRGRPGCSRARRLQRERSGSHKKLSGSTERLGHSPIGNADLPAHTMDEKLRNGNLVQRVMDLTERITKEGKATKRGPPARAASARQLQAEVSGAANGDIDGNAEDTTGGPTVSESRELVGPSFGVVRSSSAPRMPAAQRRSKSRPRESSMLADFANGSGSPEVESIPSELTAPSVWQERRAPDVRRRRSCPVRAEERELEVQVLVEEPQACQGQPRKVSSGREARCRSGSESPPQNWREMALFLDDVGQRAPKANSARDSLPSSTHLGIERNIQRHSSRSASNRPVRAPMEEVVYGSPMESLAARNTPTPRQNRQQGGPSLFKDCSKSESWMVLNSSYQTPQSDIDRTFKRGPGLCSPELGQHNRRADVARSRSPDRRHLEQSAHFNGRQSRVSWREEADVVMMAAIGRNHERSLPSTSPEPRQLNAQPTSGGESSISRQTSWSKSGPDVLFNSSASTVSGPTEEASSGASTFTTPLMQSRGASLAGSLTVPEGGRVSRDRGLTVDSSLRISKKLAAFLSHNTPYSKRFPKKVQ